MGHHLEPDDVADLVEAAFEGNAREGFSDQHPETAVEIALDAGRLNFKLAEALQAHLSGPCARPSGAQRCGCHKCVAAELESRGCF